MIDEVWIFAAARSVEWTAAQFLSMTDALPSYDPLETR
jgi:hypothetical protein